MADSRNNSDLKFDGQPEDHDLRLPARLVEALSQHDEPDQPVPESVDEAVLSEARRRLPSAARGARWRIAAGVGAAAGLAAAIALALWIAAPGQSLPWRAPRSVAAGPTDIDGNGVVDIRDALILARRVERGRGDLTRWDLNGDGTVDQRDVDAVAAQAVALETRSQS